MAGAKSYVEVQGNVAAGRLGLLTDPDSIHLSVTIYDGYSGITSLDGQPKPFGLGCIKCLNANEVDGGKSGVVWGPMRLGAPDGQSSSQFANSFVNNSRYYGNNSNFTVTYSFPSIPSGSMGQGYNSNSWAGGLIRSVTGSSPSFRFSPYQAPGYSNPLPSWLFRRN
jgi:hypothetical protein